MAFIWQSSLNIHRTKFRYCVSHSSSLPSAHILWSLPNIHLDNRLWLVQHTSTVGWNSKDLSCSEAIENLASPLILFSLSSRCSDGIDRHRQEWLDYNCPEEVRYISHVYSREMMMIFHCFLSHSCGHSLRLKAHVRTTTQYYLRDLWVPSTTLPQVQHLLQQCLKISLSLEVSFSAARN